MDPPNIADLGRMSKACPAVSQGKVQSSSVMLTKFMAFKDESLCVFGECDLKGAFLGSKGVLHQGNLR
jgi:hypothetical protein